mmetsp:Transcript_23525/g.49209  ORF Transcript_23525/g.49209 Transcript_23525/m.49209 type:complete len:106 (-) Transcript_23525:1104-1421(-)
MECPSSYKKLTANLKPSEKHTPSTCLVALLRGGKSLGVPEIPQSHAMDSAGAFWLRGFPVRHGLLTHPTSSGDCSNNTNSNTTKKAYCTDFTSQDVFLALSRLRP